MAPPFPLGVCSPPACIGCPCACAEPLLPVVQAMACDGVAESGSNALGRGARAPRRRFAFVIRLLVTLMLLGVLASRMDTAVMLLKFRGFDPAWIALAFVTVFAAIVLSAWKWGLILASLGRALAFGRLVRHYFVGLFFNNLLPTTVGGDAVRAWDTTRDTGEIPDATGSVVAERLIAGAVLGLTSIIGLPFVDTSPQLIGCAVLFLAFDLAFVLVFLVPRIAEGVVMALLPRRLGALRENVVATIASVRRVFRKPRLLVVIVAATLAFQLLVAAVNYCLFAAMGVAVTLGHCVVFTPMVFTLTMLPVSISGFGVREAAYWYFFAQAGASREEAVLGSLAFFAVVGIASLPGGILFVFGRKKEI